MESTTYRLVVECEAGSGGVRRLELVRQAPLLASAVVGGIRDVELGGTPVVRVVGSRQRVLVAADLILRLRRLLTHLSEEESALLLELLPL